MLRKKKKKLVAVVIAVCMFTMGLPQMTAYATGTLEQLQNAQQQMQQMQQPQQPVQPQASAGAWNCACGASNTGKFCSECGAPKPSVEWRCACGAVNTGKFCSECGQKLI